MSIPAEETSDMKITHVPPETQNVSALPTRAARRR
jgi:hypothetical protein